MEHKTWMTIDKTGWGDGPWQDDPDKEQWTDDATGLACLIVRNSLGSLCGYVGVPEGHPWHGKDYMDVDIDVHGGLTYAGLCQEGPESETICHVPASGEPEPLYWFGFDCAHAGDLIPTRDYRAGRSIGNEMYRTIDYVKVECARLAEQLAAGKELL